MNNNHHGLWSLAPIIADKLLLMKSPTVDRPLVRAFSTLFQLHDDFAQSPKLENPAEPATHLAELLLAVSLWKS